MGDIGSIGGWSGVALIVPLVAAVVGFLAARFLLGLGEGARREAVEAQCREEVKAAGVARDRNQAQAHALEIRLASLRDEHSECSERIEALTSDLQAYTERDLLGELNTLRAQFDEREITVTGLESRITGHERDVAALQNRLVTFDKQKQALTEARREAASAQKRSTALDGQNAELTQEIALLRKGEQELEQLQGTHAACADKIAGLERIRADHDKLRKKFDRNAAQLVERSDHATALEVDLAVAQETCATRGEKIQVLDTRVTELVRLEPLLEQRSARISALEVEQKKARKQQASLETEVARFRREAEKHDKAKVGLEQQLAGQRDRVKQLAADLDGRNAELAVGKPVWLLDAPDGEPDSLQSLTGIGAVFERRLNELGIFHFSQLEKLKPLDTAWLALRLNTTPARIDRQQWAAQAKRVMLGRKKK